MAQYVEPPYSNMPTCADVTENDPVLSQSISTPPLQQLPTVESTIPETEMPGLGGGEGGEGVGGEGGGGEGGKAGDGGGGVM